MPFSIGPFRTTLLRLAMIGATALATQAHAAPVPTISSSAPGGQVLPFDPGPVFNWPIDGFAGFNWQVPAADIPDAPYPVADFRVINTSGRPQMVGILQAFGNCGTSGPWLPGFRLFIDGAETAWSSTANTICGYHNFSDFTLPDGATQFTVVLMDGPDFRAQYVDLRFGNMIPAIPLPPSAALMLGGVLGLGMVRRRWPA